MVQAPPESDCCFEPSEKSEPPGRSRRRGCFGCGLVSGIGLLLTLFWFGPLIWSILFGASKPTISKETTRIDSPLDADGWPDYFGALNERYGGVPPEENAAVPLLAVLPPQWRWCDDQKARACELLEIDALPDVESSFETFTRFKMRVIDAPRPERAAESRDDATDAAPEAYQARDAACRQPWRPDEHPRIAQWLDENRAALDLACEASTRPHFFLPLVPTEEQTLIDYPDPVVSDLSDVIRALCARAMLRLGAGEPDAARDDLIAARRLSRLVGQYPSGIALLTSLAAQRQVIATQVDSVLAGGWSPDWIREQLASWDRLPARLSRREQLDVAERCQALDAVASLCRGRGDFEADAVKRWAMRRAFEPDIMLRKVNRLYDALDAALRRPTFTEQAEAVETLGTEIDAKRDEAKQIWSKLPGFVFQPKRAMSELVGVMLTGMLGPPLRPFLECEPRGTTVERLGRLAMALEIRRLETGEYPDALEDLTPEFFESPPVDPFTEKPFLYRRTASGCVVYSLGPNRRDDSGGEVFKQHCLGSYEPPENEDDDPRNSQDNDDLGLVLSHQPR